MRGTTTMKGKGLDSLEAILSDPINQSFLRANILKEIIPCIEQKERFLRFLWERKFMTLKDYVSYSNFGSELRTETNVLNFVLRKKRKKREPLF